MFLFIKNICTHPKQFRRLTKLNSLFKSIRRLPILSFIHCDDTETLIPFVFPLSASLRGSFVVGLIKSNNEHQTTTTATKTTNTNLKTNQKTTATTNNGVK